MVSVIAVVNKANIFEDHLKNSLSKQLGIEYELISVDNSENQYSSLVDAYNFGISRAKGDWLLFVHPDVEFLNEEALKTFFENIHKNRSVQPKIALWGCAGVETDQQTLVSTMYHGQNKKPVSEREFPTEGYAIVQTVDACCYAVHRDVIREFGFAPSLKGFHFFTEELCLHLRSAGYEIAVLPIDMWHLSSGASLDHTYYKAARAVVKKYRNESRICTTSFCWKNSLLLPFKLFYYEARNYVHHKVLQAKKKR